jgi:thioredoxin 1
MSQNLKLLDDANFNSEIAQGVTFVDFYADWCGPCRMIAPIVEELANEMNGVAKIAKLDIESAQTTTSNLGITSIPTMILFKDGKEVKRIVGVRDKESLKGIIQAAAAVA